MPSVFTFTITNAGIAAAAIAQVGGPKITIDTVKLGSAVGYTPVPGDTALHGTILHTGGIFSYTVDSANQCSYVIRLDQTIGNFSFGEVGLYLDDGTLFALAALSTVQEKVAAGGLTPGNVVSFTARLILSNIAPIINYPLTQVVNAQIYEIASVDSLPLATTLGSPNAYSISTGDDGGNSILALRQSALGLWSLDTHHTPKVSGAVEAGSTATQLNSAVIASLLTDYVAGRYVVQFTSGTKKSYCRYVNSSSAGQVLFNTLGAAPTVGDTFIVYQSNYSVIGNAFGLFPTVTGVQQQLNWYSVAGGTANAITGTFTPNITAATLATGATRVSVRAAAANSTTTPTFTPNSGVVAPATIVKGSNAALVAGDIAGAGHWIVLDWDTTLSKWVLLNPAKGVAVDTSGLAPIASPTFTGVPAAPTAAPGTNTTQLATTAFTQAALAALVASSPATLDTLNELALALGSDPNFATTMATALGGKQPFDATLTALAALSTSADKMIYATASDVFTTTTLTAWARQLLDDADAAAGLLTLGAAPLASPTFTGVPAGPTAAPGTNTTQVATTEFVTTAVSKKQIQPITAAVAANALTLTLNPTTLDFRSSTPDSGTVTTRTIAAAISMVVSNGSTLGTLASTSARLVLLAIDNAGTVELAVANLAGSLNLDETTLISTTAEGGAGAADSASVIYSTTARSNVAFRVVGFIDISEGTAGVWATGPTTIQGAGGQALAALSSLGYGQVYQDVTASRAFGTTYYNTTGKPIWVALKFLTASSISVTATVGGVVAADTAANAYYNAIGFIVPPGKSYVVSGTATLLLWSELR